MPSILKGNNDADNSYPYGTSSGNLFQTGATGDYNISSSTMTSTVSTSTSSGTSTSAFDVATAYTQQDCATIQYTADVAYLASNIINADVQAGASTNISVTEP